MWSDKELDDAFQRLSPPEPEAESFPLDAWLRLEQQLDKTAMEREFRRRLWRFFAAEVLVVAAGALLWLAWPVRQPAASAEAPVEAAATTTLAAANRTAGYEAVATATVRNQPNNLVNQAPDGAARATAAGNSSAATVAQPDHATGSATGKAASLAPTGSGQSAGGGVVRHTGHHIPAAGGAADSAASENHHRVLAAGLLATSRPRSKPARTSSEGARLAITSHTKHSSAESYHTTFVSNPFSAKSTTDGHGQRATAARGQQPLNSRTVATAEAAQTAPVSTATAAASASATANVSSSFAPGSSTVLTEIQPISIALQTDSPAALPTLLATLPLATKPLPEPIQQPRLYVGLVAARDLSTVKMTDYQDPTPNLGLLLEYRLTSRLRVSTGLLRSTKQYRARRQDYNWSYYPIAATGTFEWVDGRCTIFDVPVNLRYDVLTRPRYQVFGSAGLSSLFMQRETYAYDYEYAGTTYRWERSFTNQNQHWLSVLNLSVGYERHLGRHWRLQAEPYLKLPLGGVGAGKVRLMSGGVFFGVKYGL